MTPETLVKLRELKARATQGPWLTCFAHWGASGVYRDVGPYHPTCRNSCKGREVQYVIGNPPGIKPEDAEFIAHMQEHADALFDAVEERDRLRAATDGVDMTDVFTENVNLRAQLKDAQTRIQDLQEEVEFLGRTADT